MDVLIILMLVIIPQYIVYQITTLYTLNVYNFICQLLLNRVFFLKIL